ncbi:hypothetical protein HFO41_04595 [Rhizobium leguminosarum]|uniref:hypothetical protein n=1 Tax=Rhizobium leguminosarum TaxID=384 RepID=UPI001A92FFEC|nr:hypothetical protein [Rhizobium leguminosarum]MBY5556571.1 hypothetical protein [Rhizobium leguminosarum]MBY5636284.1 hypothetical protein [Rhizobium leguminosarum]MBY5688134.1 hypothetical protein [Rhizobium leguminosarum]MBY5726332.1 hypothetical protein [Rhizobium leguminosarum]MBY5742652.1 hypothetical protein [Rhizobium leguminosarum]
MQVAALFVICKIAPSLTSHPLTRPDLCPLDDFLDNANEYLAAFLRVCEGDEIVLTNAVWHFLEIYFVSLSTSEKRTRQRTDAFEPSV